MKSLQNYIYEQQIEEGKIWDAIKGWFKKFFEPSDKKFDLFADNYNDDSAIELNKYLLNNYNFKDLSIKSINNDLLLKILYPNKNYSPDKNLNKGFWEFENDKNFEHPEKIYAINYDSKNVKSTACLIKINIVPKTTQLENYIEIKKIQILKEFSQKLTIEHVIKMIIKNNDIMANKKGLFYYKNNKIEDPLYNKLYNDCDFEKTTMNNQNLVKKDK